MNTLEKLLSRLSNRQYFGFVQGHSHIDDNIVAQIYSSMSRGDLVHINRNFEKQFASLIASGEAVSYAAARMAFFHLMQHLHI